MEDVKTLQDLPDIEGKVVLLRADFDVAIEEGKIEDDTRIKAAIPTIKFLLDKKSKIILLSHLGRPQGVDKTLSLKPIKEILETLIGQKVNFFDNLEEKNFTSLNILENLRFWPEEEANDLKFAKKLAGLGEFYVNDSFAVCHRAHASIVGIPQFLPSFAGLRLEEEVKKLTQILKQPRKPLIAIIGGAKIETKLPAIKNLARIADKVLVGGRLMVEIQKENLAPNIIVASDDIDTKDIGKESIEKFSQIISGAGEIIWNGPLGLFEQEKYAVGTKAIAQAIIDSGAYAVVGGGETIAALNKFGFLDKMGYVSTGGGAMLEFLAGKKLPGLEALEGK